MTWIDTNTLIAICTCAIGATQFLLWRYIARNKSYESEKGKNLATKEDIGAITKEIELVKESYSKALESHKIELQKEFESHKYIQDLCRDLDNKLLSLVSECLNADASNTIASQMYDDQLVSSTIKLSNFLNTYKSRYETNPTIKDLIKISSEIKGQSDMCGLYDYDENGDLHYMLSGKNKKQLTDLLNQTISLFLPALNNR